MCMQNKNLALKTHPTKFSAPYLLGELNKRRNFLLKQQIFEKLLKIRFEAFNRFVTIICYYKVHLETRTTGISFESEHFSKQYLQKTHFLRIFNLLKRNPEKTRDLKFSVKESWFYHAISLHLEFYSQKHQVLLWFRST
jgi:hypothetical protein